MNQPIQIQRLLFWQTRLMLLNIFFLTKKRKQSNEPEIKNGKTDKMGGKDYIRSGEGLKEAYLLRGERRRRARERHLGMETTAFRVANQYMLVKQPLDSVGNQEN